MEVVKENPILPYEFTFIILSHGKLTGTKLQCEYNVPITNPLPTQYIRLFSNISEYMFNISGKDSLNSISRYNKYEVLYKFINSKCINFTLLGHISKLEYTPITKHIDIHIFFISRRII